MIYKYKWLNNANLQWELFLIVVKFFFLKIYMCFEHEKQAVLLFTQNGFPLSFSV